jgi:hypothetical protein
MSAIAAPLPPLIMAFDPRPFISQPDDAEPFVEVNSIALPAQGNSALAGVVVQFRVKPNRNGVILKIGNTFVGGGWTSGTGALIWQIFRDQALTEAIKGFANIKSSLGTIAQMQSFPPIRIYENQVISMVLLNVAVVVAQQIAEAGFIGYFYPKNREWQGIGV